MDQDTILEINSLSLGFGTQKQATPILDKVSFSVARNEILAVVGESGCGKSVTAMSIMRLLKTPPAQYLGGSILFHGEDLLSMPAKQLRHIRGNKISMIFQEPLTSLNPVMTIGAQVAEALSLHRKMSRAEIQEKTIELLRSVRIPSPETRLKNYPGQYSGGMRQRIMIAMAIACQPEILIADEPTTALDVTIQAQILKLLKQLQQETRMSIILITHDLGVVAESAHRVVVMYAGQILEMASTKELFSKPLHPYTRGLLDSLPKLDTTGDRLKTIEGSVPSARNMPKGCRFHPRCSQAMPICVEVEPDLVDAGGHLCKCHLMTSNAGGRNE